MVMCADNSNFAPKFHQNWDFQTHILHVSTKIFRTIRFFNCQKFRVCNWGGRLYSNTLCCDKCYFNCKSRRQTRHYTLHSHLPGSDNFMFNAVSGI